MDTSNVVDHFTERAERYDGSSHWCTDPALMACVLGHLQPKSEHQVLDVACGRDWSLATFAEKWRGWLAVTLRQRC